MSKRAYWYDWTPVSAEEALWRRLMVAGMASPITGIWNRGLLGGK